MDDTFSADGLTREQIKEMADLAANKAITEEGMLSPVVDVFSEQLKEAHARSFNVATKLNRLAMKAWLDAPNDGEPDDLHPIANRLMLRALNSFAGCIILARRGMDAEAQTLARSIYECAFWLGWFHTNPEQALADFKLDSERGLAEHKRACVKVVPDSVDPDALREAEELLKKGDRAPGPKALAEKSDMSASFVYYKALCGVAAHSTLTSIGRYLAFDDEGRPGHEFNFEGDGIPETVGFACFGLIEAISRFAFTSRAPVDPKPFMEIAEEIRWMFGNEVPGQAR